MTIRFVRHALSAAVLSLPAFCSLAATAPAFLQSSATVGNLSYTLKDLNLLDFKKPSLTLTTDPKGPQEATLYAGSYSQAGDPSSIKVASQPFDSVSKSLAGPDLTVASKTGNSVSAQTNLFLPTVAGALQNATSSTNLAMASVGSSSYWTLGAYSQVTIQGNLTVKIDLDASKLPTAGVPGRGSLSVNTSASVGLSELGFDGNFYFITGDQVMSGSGWNTVSSVYYQNNNGTSSVSTPGATSGTLTKNFTLTLANKTSKATQFTFGANNQSTVNWYLQPIPEPSTYALMALGLGLMAWRVRATRRG